MHLLVTDILWDASKRVKSSLPTRIVVLDAPEGADNDEDFISMELSDALSNNFNFCHAGFEVQPLLLPIHGTFAIMKCPES